MVSLGDTLASSKSTERPGLSIPIAGEGLVPRRAPVLKTSSHQSDQRTGAFRSLRVSDLEGVAREQHLHLDISDRVPCAGPRLGVRASHQCPGVSRRAGCHDIREL